MNNVIVSLVRTNRNFNDRAEAWKYLKGFAAIKRNEGAKVVVSCFLTGKRTEFVCLDGKPVLLHQKQLSQQDLETWRRHHSFWKVLSSDRAQFLDWAASERELTKAEKDEIAEINSTLESIRPADPRRFRRRIRLANIFLTIPPLGVF